MSRSGDLSGYQVECFGCGEWLSIKMSKKGLAYWVCNGCFIQVFLRKIANEDLEEKDFAFSIRTED
mgnify:CR=1 FL=1